MNHYNDDAFNNVIKGLDDDTGPYGIPAHSIPVKPGLTKRGKVAIAVGTGILATTGTIFWQHSSAVEAESQAKQQAIQLENKKLDLEMLKEMNRASAATSKSKDSPEAEQQKQIAACVDTDKGLVGKQMGVTYSSVLADCRAQYQTTSSSMQTAASAEDTNTSGSGGGIGPGGLLAIGGGAAALVAVAAIRGKKTNAA
ncbi:hypothetical protein [Streptomyces olivaceoviridis]|uniref:hypothetical protein n=1 Tax=Streptomyces olivaceoviridis TaxID=1921 RepID=UPI00368BC683